MPFGKIHAWGMDADRQGKRGQGIEILGIFLFLWHGVVYCLRGKEMFLHEVRKKGVIMMEGGEKVCWFLTRCMRF